MLVEALEQFSTQLEKANLGRRREVIQDKDCISFSSNDYLSLSSDSRIQKAYQAGFQRYPAGSGGSMVVCGYHPIHQTLERAFAQALGVDECLLFSSGFSANLSIGQMLGKLNAHAFIDKGVHASIYDGLKLAKLPYTRYLHHNLCDLAAKLPSATKRSVVLTESIFSMSGQLSNLASITQMARMHHCEVLVDEAHAFGLIGKQGLGSIIQHGLTQEDVPLRMIPLGKAYAAFGAIVAGSALWVDALLQSARPYIYSTALSPAIAYGLLKTLDIVRQADERRNTLQELIQYFRKAIAHSPLSWRDSQTPIQQLQIGCPHRALEYAKKLRKYSMICLPMRSPTVSRQDTGLRIVLNYHHQPEQIDQLIQYLHD